MAKRVRKNEMNVQWTYAKACWDALRAGNELPPIPLYQIYESDEAGGKEKQIGEKQIVPMPVTYGGVTYFR